MLFLLARGRQAPDKSYLLFLSGGWGSERPLASVFLFSFLFFLLPLHLFISEKKGKDIEVGRERRKGKKTESTAKRFPAKDLLNENNTLELLFIGEDIVGLAVSGGSGAGTDREKKGKQREKTPGPAIFAAASLFVLCSYFLLSVPLSSILILFPSVPACL